MFLPHSLLQTWSNFNSFKAQVFIKSLPWGNIPHFISENSYKILICRNTIKSYIFCQPHFSRTFETELDSINPCSYMKLFCLSESTLGGFGNDKILSSSEQGKLTIHLLFMHSFIQEIFNKSLPYARHWNTEKYYEEKNNTIQKRR